MWEHFFRSPRQIKSMIQHSMPDSVWVNIILTSDHSPQFDEVDYKLETVTAEEDADDAD